MQHTGHEYPYDPDDRDSQDRRATMDVLFDFFLPMPSLSTTSSAHTTPFLFGFSPSFPLPLPDPPYCAPGPPRSLKVPTEGGGWLSGPADPSRLGPADVPVTVTVREPLDPALLYDMAVE